MKSHLLSPAGHAVAAEIHTEPAARKTPPLTRERLLGEIAMRVLTVLVYSIFLWAALQQFYKDPSRITLILLALSELITIGLAVCSRVPRERDWNPATVVISICVSFYFVTLRIKSGIHLVPETVAAGLQIAGIVIQISAKLSLRRSFGILPANRGVVVSGPYRFLRHPIYFGYGVNQLGFLLSNFGVQNLVVLVLLWSSQVFRVVREERVLIKDAKYREYAARVRYRFIPGIF